MPYGNNVFSDIIYQLSEDVKYAMIEKIKVEMKKYYFLAGLPRSGNTLLSSILNQNPDIMVSANSFLCDHMHQTAMFQFDEKFKNFPDADSLNDLISSTFDSYYKNWDAKYIIDRGPWGTPTNLYMLENYLSNEVKIICTVRDIVEIISSTIKVSFNRLRNIIQEQRNNNQRFFESYKSELELMCEVLTDPSGQLETFMFSLNNLLKEQNRGYLHIVEYNDLVHDTDNVIKKIYDFLGIEQYEHKYGYIKQFSANGVEYDDSIFDGDLHKIKSKIKQKKYAVEDVLPPHIIQKYSNLEFWRN